MALSEQDIAKLLIKIREKVPEVYRHLIGVIVSIAGKEAQ